LSRRRGAFRHIGVQSIEIIEELLAIRTGDDVFPSPVGDKPISRVQCWRVTKAVTNNAGTNHMVSVRRSGRGAPAHGVDREVAKLAIAHTVGGVEGLYQRDPMIERRRPMMQAWADWVTSEGAGATVIPFAEKRG
jgi:hypothetical protein